MNKTRKFGGGLGLGNGSKPRVRKKRHLNMKRGWESTQLAKLQGATPPGSKKVNKVLRGKEISHVEKKGKIQVVKNM